MNFKHYLLTAVSALVLVSCGGGDDKAASADPKAASPVAQSFTLKNAEPMDVDAFFAVFPEDGRPTYESATFDKSIGATVIENLVFADDDDGEGISIKKAEIFGYDAEAVERINDSAGGIDAPYETVFEKIRLFDVTAIGVDDDGAEFAIGGVELDKLAVRRGGIEANPTGHEIANFFNAVSLDGLFFKDITAKANADETGDFAMSAPDLRFVGISGGKLASVVAKDLDYTLSQSDESRAVLAEAMGEQGAALFNSPLAAFIAPGNQRTTAELFEWRDVDMSGLLKIGLTGESATTKDRKLMDLGTFKFENMASYINGKPAMTAPLVEATALKFDWMLPSHIRIEQKNSVSDFTAYLSGEEEPAYAVLMEHGLNSVSSSGVFDYKWNADKGDAKLVYDTDASGIMDFSSNFAISGLTLKAIEVAEANDGVELADNLQIDGFDLTLKDTKALDIVFGLAALQMGGTGDDLRSSAPALLRLSGTQFSQMNPRINGYIDALADFLSDGGTLSIKADPEKPVGLAGFQSGEHAPQDAPDVLNLTVTHSE